METVTAIIGAGAMGRGIAQVFASGGYRVFLYDISSLASENAIGWIKSNLEDQVRKEKITQEEARQILRRITISSGIPEAVHTASLIIETVPENMEIKQKVVADISESALPSALIATNTSTMSITEIGSGIKSTGRFLGIHFFHPVQRMELVEVIYGRETEEETANRVFRTMEEIGKKPVRVLKDTPGFIVNRVNAPTQALINAVIQEGTIPPEQIDCSMRKLGMPMGPFEISDFVGLDVFVDTLRYYSVHLSADYAPGSVLVEKVARGELGSKSGKGIYEWRNGKALISMERQSTEITALSFMAIQVNEAVKIVRDGIALSRQDVDNAVKHGMNAFAGPFALAAGIDPSRIRDELHRLNAKYGLSIFNPEPEIVDGSFITM